MNLPKKKADGYVCQRCRQWVGVDQLHVCPAVMSCGHPHACLVSADDGTSHCAWCADSARWREWLRVAIDNAKCFRNLVLEYERKVAELEAELTREQMRAASRGGKL